MILRVMGMVVAVGSVLRLKRDANSIISSAEWSENSGRYRTRRSFPQPYGRRSNTASDTADFSSFSSIPARSPPLNLSRVAMMNVKAMAQHSLYERSWVNASGDEDGDGCQAPKKEKGISESLRILQFNVLADCLTSGTTPISPGHKSRKRRTEETKNNRTFGMTKYCKGPIDWKSRVFLCDHSHLFWEKRFPLLLYEIINRDPDIICLQEVDRFDEFQAFLRKKGYSGRFVKKSFRARDGCAVFWKSSRMNNTAIECVTLHSENVHVAMMLRMQIDSRSVIIVNTHLKAGLEQHYEDFRVEQLKCLLEKVKDFQKEDEDIILCGDLNSHVETYESVKAVAYPFLTQCGFRNAYGRKPKYTHWGGWMDSEVKMVFDYILYLGNVRVRRVLQVPCESKIEESPERLPNGKYPSDHVSLVADIELLSNPSPSSPSVLPVHNPTVPLVSISRALKFVLSSTMPDAESRVPQSSSPWIESRRRRGKSRLAS